MEKKKFNIESSLSIKRFHFDGVIEVECPECKSKMEHNFEDSYLSYPCPGEDMTIYFWCDGCDNEFEMPGKLEAISVEISYDNSKLKKI